MTELLPLLVGCAISVALLIIEHLAFWPYRRLPSYLARYALGTAALAVGLTVWAALTDRLIAAVAMWAIVGSGWVTLMVAYWCRWLWAKIRGEVDQQAFWAGQIAGLPEDHDGPPGRSYSHTN